MGAVEFKLSNPLSNAASGSSVIQNASSSKSLPDRSAAETRRPPRELGDLEMRITRDGTWLYRGSPISRLALVKLFASVLHRELDGSHWLVTPAERGRVEVEDVPFLAVALTVEGSGREQQLIFQTNLDDIVTAGAANPLRVETAADGEPRPYVVIRDQLEARIVRPVFYDLVDLGTEERVDDTVQFGVWSGGRFFPLGDPVD